MLQARLLPAPPRLGSTSLEDGSRKSTRTWSNKMRWTKHLGLRRRLLHQRLQRIQRLLPNDPERQWWAAVVPKATVEAVRPGEDTLAVMAVPRQTEQLDRLPSVLGRCAATGLTSCALPKYSAIASASPALLLVLSATTGTTTTENVLGCGAALARPFRGLRRTASASPRIGTRRRTSRSAASSGRGFYF